MANLYKNYSPQLKPELESQNLNHSLLEDAKNMLRVVLYGWQESIEKPERENRGMRRAVDTTLARMAAKAGADDDCLDLIGRNTVAMQDLIEYIEAEGKNALLAKVYERIGRHEALLALWIRYV